VQPIFWTLPTEYMTGYAAAAGIALINSLGNLGGFLAPVLRDSLEQGSNSNAGLYALALGAVAAAVLLALTGLFPRANQIETGEAETIRAVQARTGRGPRGRVTDRTSEQGSGR
jgi:nitrate/nitrite transporter NarK